MNKWVVIVLSGFLIISPMLFVWNVEIIQENGVFTNGYVIWSQVQIYHLSMYLLFITNGLAFLYMLNSLTLNPRKNK